MARLLGLLIIVTALAACSSDKTAGTAGGAGAGGADGGAAGLANGGLANGGSANGGSAGRGAPGSQEDLAQTAGERILFETDRSTLTPQASATLDRQIAWLQQYPQVSVAVAGNCDERGTEEYNLALGQRRAMVDRDYLVAHSIDQRRIQTISYGKDRPVDAASTPDAWAQNRNAVTSVR